MVCDSCVVGSCLLGLAGGELAGRGDAGRGALVATTESGFTHLPAGCSENQKSENPLKPSLQLETESRLRYNHNTIKEQWYFCACVPKKGKACEGWDDWALMGDWTGRLDLAGR